MSIQSPLSGLESIRKVHIIGACGTLMGAFASYLKRAGIHVTGSDQNIYPPMSDVLKNAGIQLYSGYHSDHLLADGQKPDLVVIGNVIGRNNPEAKAAIEQGFQYTSLPAAMEQFLLKKTKNLVVAGTHGKTTTSSLLAHVLVKCGKDPSYFIGGVPHDLPYSFHVSKTDSQSCFVLEGDEYDTAFWDKVPKFTHYLPDHVLLTSIEYDHADIYPDIGAVVEAFRGLFKRVRRNGSITACVDYPIIRDLIQSEIQNGIGLITYGSPGNQHARFTPGNIAFTEEGSRFEVLEQGKKVAELQLQIPGLHNILNALAVWIEGRELGLDSTQLASALKSFRGVKRRQEVRAEVRGITVIDDFAHHPTAVRETLKALKVKYPNRRLITAFEPRSATSRRKVFQKEYSLAFEQADVVFIASPFDQSKILPEDQFSSDMLVKDLVDKGKKAYLMSSTDDGVLSLSKLAKQGDIVAVLSNGGFDGFIPKLIAQLTQVSEN